MGMITIVEFKKRVANSCILRIVVGKLNHSKKPGLIILLVLDKSPKVGFYWTILPLSRAVSLRMKDSGESLLDFQEVIE